MWHRRLQCIIATYTLWLNAEVAQCDIRAAGLICTYIEWQFFFVCMWLWWFRKQPMENQWMLATSFFHGTRYSARFERNLAKSPSIIIVRRAYRTLVCESDVFRFFFPCFGFFAFLFAWSAICWMGEWKSVCVCVNLKSYLRTDLPKFIALLDFVSSVCLTHCKIDKSAEFCSCSLDVYYDPTKLLRKMNVLDMSVRDNTLLFGISTNKTIQTDLLFSHIWEIGVCRLLSYALTCINLHENVCWNIHKCRRTFCIVVAGTNSFYTRWTMKLLQ